MNIPQPGETTGQYVLRCLHDGETRSQVEQKLLEQGHEMWFVKEIMAESVKLYYAKRRSKGLSLILAGAVVCFISFLLTITGAFSGDAYGFVLFGLTSAGIIIVFAGFVFVF